MGNTWWGIDCGSGGGGGSHGGKSVVVVVVVVELWNLGEEKGCNVSGDFYTWRACDC